MKECKLTTVDNPYDPFEDFDSWFLYDVEKKHNCCSILARTIKFTDDMSQVEMDIETERAIDEIIKYDFQNKYKKVTRNIPDDTENVPSDPAT